MNGKERKDKQHIQVFARIRPFNDSEKLHNANHFMQVNGRDIVVPQTHGTRRFTFDKVFDIHSKQVNIYKEAISPIIQEVLKGYNCTVFAYGQTGSGKTHTMVGPELTENAMTFNADSDVGIIPRAMGHIFDSLGREKELDYTIRVSYLEIYNEVLNDLLSTDDKSLRIYEDPKNKSSVQIHGLEEKTVYSKTDVYDLLRTGSEKRKIAATYMNQHSSRSHSVFTITVHMKETTPEGEELVKTGKLNLVDLAGSENIQRSGAVDQRAREAGNINQSLLTLGRVIKALVDKAGHIPYRESKLTRILQDSLGGKTKTTIIATASPSITNLEETLSTLDYAYRARNIITKPEVNQRLCKTAMIKGYLEEIDKLKKDLTAARKGEGFYLNVDSYQSLIRENISNKEEYLRAVKECAEFESRASELQRQCTDLEEVYSATQQDLTEAKSTLQKSKVHLKQLCRDRHIRQELIDKYSETESQHFKTSKEMSVAFDNHIREHNILCDKLKRFYESMQENENATDCFKQEQSHITGTIEDYYDKLHEDLIRQLQDTKTSTLEFVQQQSSCINRVEIASANIVSSYIESIQSVSEQMKIGQAQRLDALEQQCNLSTDTMQIIKEHLEKENSLMHTSLNQVCSYIETNKTAYNEIFKNWQCSVNEVAKDVKHKNDATIAKVRIILKETNELLAQLSAEMKVLKKPVDDAAKERLELQKAFDAFMKKSDQLANNHHDLLNRISEKTMTLNTDADSKWAQYEEVTKAQVANTKNKLDGISKVGLNAIELTNTAFDHLTNNVLEIQKKHTVANGTAAEIINTKSEQFILQVDERKLEAEKFEVAVQKNLENYVQKAYELKSESLKRTQESLSDVTHYNKTQAHKIATVIDTVKSGIQECSRSLAELSGVGNSFISSLQILKPSGETPSHKNRITYNIPRKVSKRVLQYKDLNLSSISILDESMDQSSGRPSLDFFDQNDSDLEYQGQFVTTEVQKKEKKPAKKSLNVTNENVEPSDDT